MQLQLLRHHVQRTRDSRRCPVHDLQHWNKHLWIHEPLGADLHAIQAMFFRTRAVLKINLLRLVTQTLIVTAWIGTDLLVAGKPEPHTPHLLWVLTRSHRHHHHLGA